MLLALVYYECPMLCTQVLNGVTGALKALKFDVGKEFDVVAVSIDPAKVRGSRLVRSRPTSSATDGPHTADGWHFLTGREENIRALATAVGFRYVYDEEIKQYAHGAGVELAHAEGRHRPLLLRDRVFAARSSPRDHRSLRGEDRIADR